MIKLTDIAENTKMQVENLINVTVLAQETFNSIGLDAWCHEIYPHLYPYTTLNGHLIQGYAIFLKPIFFWDTLYFCAHCVHCTMGNCTRGGQPRICILNHFKVVKKSCRFSICWGGGVSTNIWKIQYVFCRSFFKSFPKLA